MPDPTQEGTRVTTIVVESERKKKPRKYSAGLGLPGELERGASRALHRLAQSVEVGLDTWRKESDRSARRRRDGALRDASENAAEAVARAVRVAGRAPVDAAKTLPRLKLRKVSRRIVSTLLG
jgi:hypothetical protein